MCTTREVRVRQTTSWFSPVPPAIMPRCLAVLVSAGDFLSACTAKTPAGGTRTSGGVRTDSSSRLNPSPLHQHQQGALTFALVYQQTAGSPEVDDVVDLEALQVLAHLPALWEFGVGVFKVDLPAGGSGVNVVTKIRLDTKEEQECVCFYLDHQVNDALVVIAGDWSVWTHHQFAVNLGGEVDVLPCRGRKHHRRMRVKIKSAIKMCYIKKGNDRQNYLTFF